VKLWAGDDKVGIEQEPNRVIDSGAASQQLQVIPVKLAMELVDVTANTPRFCKFLCKVCVVAMESMATSLMIILYMRGVYSTPLKVYSLR
jgi:hypothetical protein